MSRVYDALRKFGDQEKEPAPSSAPPLPGGPESTDPLLSVPVLTARIGPQSRIAMFTGRRTPGAERFRLIRMALRNLNGTKPPKVLLVTSPLPKDGKSTVALNLATSLAEEGRVKVLLLEADLHCPCFSQHLGIQASGGVTEILEGSLDLTAALRRIEPLGIYMLAAGRIPGNPDELLQGERFGALLHRCRSLFEWILIDCPPAFPLTDVLVLRPHADGVLLVARANATPRQALQEAVQLFKPGQVVGVILNAAEEVKRMYQDYQNYHRREPSTVAPRLGGEDK